MENKKAQLEEDFIKLGLGDKENSGSTKDSSKPSQVSQAKVQPSKAKAAEPVSGARNLPKVGSGIAPVTGAQAASSWLAAAKSENTGANNTMALLVIELK